jgi:hypothetical protein
MNDSFYVTLLSDISAELYPENAPHRFSNKLHRRVELSGHWEVAVLEIHFPMTMCNADSQSCKVWLSKNDKIILRSGIEDGYFDNIQKVLATLQEGLENYYIFEVTDNRVVCKTNTLTKTALRFSNTLAHQLGLCVTKEFVEGHIRGDRIPDLLLGIPSHLFIHCNAIRPQIFGDRVEQSLRSFTINLSDYKYGSQGTVSFSKPVYVPVCVNALETLTISIKDANGSYPVYLGGRSTVLLHFRRALHA